MERDPFQKQLSDPKLSNKAVGERLRLVRLNVAHIRTQRAMAKALGVEEDAYNAAERGKGLSRPMKLRVMFLCPGISGDYLDTGDTTLMPLGLLKALGELP